MATTQETVLSVPDICCAGCARKINDALESLAGVELVAVDAEAKTVQLRYDPAQVSNERIDAAVEEAGYAVAR